MAKTSGVKDEYMLKHLFNMYDIDSTKTLTIHELNALCLALGIPLERRLTEALLDHLDVDKSGAISFEEFSAFVSHGIYTRLT